MTVVVDTNVLPGMFTTGHGYRPIADAWFDGIFAWAVSTEILLEYEEVLVELKGHAMARRILALIERVGALQGNLHRVSPSFSFRTIPTDLDDDKFADCAIIADADHIITSTLLTLIVLPTLYALFANRFDPVAQPDDI